MKHTGKALLRVIALTLMIALMFTSCGGSGKTDTSSLAQTQENAAKSRNTEGAGGESSTAGTTASESTASESTASTTSASSTASEPSPTGGSSDTGVTSAKTGVLALKGPTAIGLVDLMNRSETGDMPYTFHIAAAPDEAVAAIVKGEVDIAAVPANMAAVLYKKTEGAVRVLGINTLGVLYICGFEDGITSIKDLAGKTVYASGKGASPEYVLTHLLQKNGVEANIEWKSEHGECVAALAQDPSAIAMLPQPFVSAAKMKNPNLRVLVDLTAEWDAVNESTLITGVVVARREFLEANPAAANEFLEQYAASVKAVNENTEEIGALVEKFGIVPAKVANAAIPQCNIVLITGEEMKTALGKYLEILHGMNPKSVGGQLPDDAFYYNK